MDFYKNNIETAINKLYWLKYHDQEDMREYITTALIKLYRNKYKYDEGEGFDYVVLASIKRRASDFRNMLSRSSVEMPETSVCNDEEGNWILNNKSCDYTQKQQKGVEIHDVMCHMKHEISEGKYADKFTDWEREYFDAVLFIYEKQVEGVQVSLEPKIILECMGLDQEGLGSFAQRTTKFRKKIREYFGEYYGLV